MKDDSSKAQGAMAEALKDAGVVQQSHGIGRGRGPIRVRRFEVEKIFLREPDRLFPPQYLSKLLDTPLSNLMCHIHRMKREGLLTRSGTTGNYYYQKAPKFTRPSKINVRMKHAELGPVEGGPLPMKPQRPAVAVVPFNGSLTPHAEDHVSIQLQMERLRELLDTADKLLIGLMFDYGQLRGRLEKLL